MSKTWFARAVGSRVRRARISAGLTQSALAKKAKTGQTTVSQIETGKRPLRVAQLFAIAEACHKPLKFFAPGGASRRRSPQ